MTLLKNWKILLWMAFIVFSIWIVFSSGLNFGIDFKGGTLFQIHFSEKVKTAEEMERVTNVIEQRLNWTGLKDVKVVALGNELVMAQLAETDPEVVNRLEALLKKQGRFEVIIQGKVAFTGEDVVAIDQTSGTGLPPFQSNGSFFSWNMPFSLKSKAAEKFRDLSFHQCRLLTLENSGTYDCEVTYFFIDRPQNAVIILPQEQYGIDKELLLQGNILRNIPSQADIDKIIEQSGLDIRVISSNTLTEEQKLFAADIRTVIIPENADPALIAGLQSLNYSVKLEPVLEDIPWLWQVAGLRSIVRLQPSVTGDQPYVAAKENFQPLQDLIITGSGVDQESAKRDRLETKAILQAGSLPVSVESITKESVSPLLGKNFLTQAWIMGLLAILLVALIIFLRYRKPKLVVPIVAISLTETFIAVVFTSMVGNITLESIAAIIASVGTGVNDQIIITDELLSGSMKSEVSSFAARIKRAFFIVIGSAATTLATMLPILIFGGALIKLVGFAIATIVAVLVGVLITRPAFSEIAQKLIQDTK
ncbi:MAG: hypothetical protein Q7S92_03980 [Candidatus Diapherotrites archaeon]|nr:hypothetical protein [Candidatus Diapherotrites archaeon]